MKSETSLKLFELTQEFIPNKKQAGLFVQRVEETIDDKMEQRHEHLSTKTDLAALQLEVRDQKVELMEVILQQKVELMGVINDQKAELMGVVINQKTELKDDIATLRLEVRDQKADLIRSIYLVGLVQFLAIVGSVLAIVTLMLK
tara:strand:- start:598 stop:1032 length:435 start_codon:yes stop_codon:yes gene_type:complete